MIQFFLIAISDPPRRDAILVLAEKNVLMYIAGYAAKRVMAKACSGCNSVLSGSLSGSDAEKFLVNKQFEGLSSSGLVVPSIQLAEAVERLEATYKVEVCKLMHMKKVKARLTTLLNKTISDTSLVCPKGACPLKKLVVDLFVNIRLYSTLKDNSSMFVEQKGKRNRKIMKLSHV